MKCPLTDIVRKAILDSALSTGTHPKLLMECAIFVAESALPRGRFRAFLPYPPRTILLEMSIRLARSRCVIG